jgi:hypothetical protein
MKPAIASIIDQFTHPSTCPTTPSPTSPLKLLHQSIPQHVLHKSLIRRRVAPRLQLHFLRHSPRETSRPLLARIRSDDVGDGCVGDKVWIETYVILIVLVNTLWCVMCNEVDPMEWLSGLRCLSRPSCLKFRRVSLVAFGASGPWPRARAQLHMSVYYSPKAANLSNQHHQLTLLVGMRYLVFAVEMNVRLHSPLRQGVCVVETGSRRPVVVASNARILAASRKNLEIPHRISRTAGGREWRLCFSRTSGAGMKCGGLGIGWVSATEMLPLWEWLPATPTSGVRVRVNDLQIGWLLRARMRKTSCRLQSCDFG